MEQTRSHATAWTVMIGIGLIALTLNAHGVRPDNFVIGFLSLAAIFLPLERVFASRPQRILRDGWRTDVMHYFCSSAMTGSLIALLSGVVVISVAPHLLPASIRHAAAHQPLPAEFLEAVIVGDFFGYWAHRLSHQWPLLWRFHSVHHSIERMDWLASARFHPVDQLITRGAALVPLQVLGLSLPTFTGYVLLQSFLEFAVHANVSVRIGPAKWLIANPEFHHWHHATDAAAHNRNFAASLPLLDLVMGTAYLPANKRPAGYGTDEVVGRDYVSQLLHPFQGPRRARTAETAPTMKFATTDS